MDVFEFERILNKEEYNISKSDLKNMVKKLKFYYNPEEKNYMN